MSANRVDFPARFATGALYVGSCPPPWVTDVDVVVLCARELERKITDAYFVNRPVVLRARLDDSGAPMKALEKVEALAAGRRVADYLRKGARVLVTCNLGRNRSGLVAALALVQLGMAPMAAIDLVRRARAPRGALSNKDFIEFLFHPARVPAEVRA